MSRRLVILALFAVLAAGAEAQDLSQFDKVLLPVWTPVQITGANGSKFQTDLLVQPQSRPVNYYPGPRTIEPDIPIILNLFDFVPSAHGRLLYVEKGGLETLTFGYEVVAVEASGVARYTTLPVVRERDFHTGPIDLVGVPTWPTVNFQNYLGTGYRQRNMLRVYDVDNTGTLRVRVTWGTINQSLPPTRPASRDLNVTSRDFDDPSYPYYAEVDLDTLIPPCFGGITGSTPCAPTARTVRITPLAEGARFWAFISSTDNTTQAVQIFVPQ